MEKEENIPHKIDKPEVELSQEGEGVLRLLENSNNNIFLTGRAGTGKSTILRYFRATTKKNIAVLAPTGVAAINVQGQTIHSFFKFKVGVTIDDIHKKSSKIYRNIDTLIIDEISMVRADLFDCIDLFMRLNGKDKDKPFGGAQVIVIGDLYQLPPVMNRAESYIFDGVYESPYFFHAHCFGQADFLMVELNDVYRQSEKKFIDILDAIRSYDINARQMAELNQRVVEAKEINDDMAIFLVSTNMMADSINLEKLERISEKEKKYTGFISGSFNERELPTKKELLLKKGSQVMLLNNDQRRRWVNGDIAKVISLEKNFIEVEFEDGRTELVEKYSWEKFSFIYDEDEDKIKSESAGNFSQFPLKLAWAITIHKGQGKTYDRVIVDFGNGTFAPGQAYVALSRCKNMEGLMLKKPLERRHIIVDTRVLEFMNNYPKVNFEEMFDD
ncbi:MAG: AAA family ATPase [Candidatus Pacebacteria bacterium]|nr:AAA family ATPase [Candidatus Paceibacterota bacterium]